MRVVSLVRAHGWREHFIVSALPKAGVLLVAQSYFIEPLDAAGANGARHHYTQRKAMVERQWLTIHLPGQNDVLGVEHVAIAKETSESADIQLRKTTSLLLLTRSMLKAVSMGIDAP